MENIVDDIAITLAYSFVIISCETIDIDEIWVIILSEALCPIGENDQLNNTYFTFLSP
jgi:hypothetical protein